MGTSPPPYEQRLDGCLQKTIGEQGLSAGTFEAYVKRTGPVLQRLRRAAQEGTLPLLSLWQESRDLAACRRVADRLTKEAADVVVFGTGGSSLGAQALAQVAGHRTAGFLPAGDRPRLHFFDTLDAEGLAAALQRLDLARTRFLVISKSGGTAETMMQMLTALEAVAARVGDSALKDHFAVITEARATPLRQLAARHGFTVLDHHAGIGGRFSVLSNVGLLPALVLGLDAAAVRAGAGAALAPILDGAAPRDCAPATGAALSVALAKEKGKRLSVLMPYAERLDLFAMWYRQLWAESLGKGGEGTTPIRALGPVDQHSQLQLYLDGPNDKLVTLIMTQTKGRGPRVPASYAGHPDLGYLAGRTVGDLVDAEQRATAEALINNGRPVRVMKISRVDEYTLGALFMHFMLETIIAADLLGVDPFDQPAVEEGKVLARRYLAEMGGK